MNKENKQGTQEKIELTVTSMNIQDVLYCPYPECGHKAALSRNETDWRISYLVHCTNPHCRLVAREGLDIKTAVRNWCRLSVDAPMGWRLFLRMLWMAIFKK